MIWPSRSKSNTYSPAPAFFAPGVRAASRFMRVSSDPVPRAADDALDADDLGVLEHRQAMREVGWNVGRLARAEVEDLGAEREPGFPLQQEQDLLLGVRMLLRAFAGLVAQDAKLDSLASDQAAKGARMLRRDELFLQLLDVVAVLVHPRRVAAQPQDRLEEPVAVRVLHRILPGHCKFAAARVAVFALGAPVALLEKESMVYPCTFTLSAGASRR